MNKFFSNTQKITSAKLKRLLKQLFPPGGDDKSVKLNAIQKTNILCSIWKMSSTCFWMFGYENLYDLSRVSVRRKTKKKRKWEMKNQKLSITQIIQSEEKIFRIAD